MNNHTTLEQSQAIDKLAREHEDECDHMDGKVRWHECPVCKGQRIFPYAKTGIAGWLADREYEACGGRISLPDGTFGVAVPTLVWTTDVAGGKGHFLVRYPTETCNPPYIHALDYLTAFAFLAECYEWDTSLTIGYPSSDGDYWAVRYGGEVLGDTPSELLDKMLAAIMGVKK